MWHYLHMTSLHRGDRILHHPDGTHRSTPPSTSGRVLAAYERRLRAHLASHQAPLPGEARPAAERKEG